MGDKKVYSSLSIYPELIDKVVQLKEDLGLKNNSQSIQILLTAFDIVNSSQIGGGFTEAVKEVMERA